MNRRTVTVNLTKVAVLLFSVISLLLISNCKSNKGYGVLDTPVKVVDKFGKSRKYKLYIDDKVKKTSLLVYFHGVRSEGFKYIPTLKGYTGSPIEETGLIEFCKSNKIALLVPKTRYTYKFLNCNANGWSPFEKEIDGIEKIIDTVVKNFDIDKQKVYLYGISAGAVLVNHLANRRPKLYNAILSHSQGYISEDNKQLIPRKILHKFGVVICYTKGDYKNLISICKNTYKIYKEAGFKAVLLENLKPDKHSWDKGSNRLFWRMMNRLGQYTGRKKDVKK